MQTILLVDDDRSIPIVGLRIDDKGLTPVFGSTEPQTLILSVPSSSNNVRSIILDISTYME